MILERGFEVPFIFKGRNYTCKVYKMLMTEHRPKRFFRVYSPNGNRDLIYHEGQWIIIYGNPIPEEILDSIGNGITKAMQDSINNF